MSSLIVKPGQGAAMCPYYEAAAAGSAYPEGGMCKGLPGGMPMVPTLDERSRWCTTANCVQCPIFRSRRGEGGLASWLREEYEVWGGIPVSVKDELASPEWMVTKPRIPRWSD